MKAKRLVEVFMILRCRFSSSVPKTITHASFSAKCSVRLCAANISKSSILNIFPLMFCEKENPTNTFAIRSATKQPAVSTAFSSKADAARLQTAAL